LNTNAGSVMHLCKSMYSLFIKSHRYLKHEFYISPAATIMAKERDFAQQKHKCASRSSAQKRQQQQNVPSANFFLS